MARKCLYARETKKQKLVKKYLENYIKDIGINFDKFISYGFLNDKNKFWLPAFAIRFSNFINGVSKIHCDVSKKCGVFYFQICINPKYQL
jgi:glucan phosphorylase